MRYMIRYEAETIAYFANHHHFNYTVKHQKPAWHRTQLNIVQIVCINRIRLVKIMGKPGRNKQIVSLHGKQLIKKK
jgi:hypothetical protein